MKFCINVYLLPVIIPIVFGRDQIKAERMAFNKPVVMATDQGSPVLIHFRIYYNFFLTTRMQNFRTFARKT